MKGNARLILLFTALVVVMLCTMAVVLQGCATAPPMDWKDAEGHQFHVIDAEHYTVDCNTCTVIPGTHYASCTLMACEGDWSKP